MNRKTQVLILRLYDGRCIGVDTYCGKWGVEFSHIVPKSSGGADDETNVVLHCSECHRTYHDRGTSDEAIRKMQQHRKNRLQIAGKEEYI